MKKHGLALSTLAIFTGMAQAQANVTLHGFFDTGLVKETGSDLKMSP